MDALKLTLVTPLKKIFEGLEVSEIKLPADKGELTIYPDHSPLVTTLDTGVLLYKETGAAQFSKLAITWGYCEVINGEVRLLADKALKPGDLKLDDVEKEKKEAEASLSSNTLEPSEIKKVQANLKELEAQLSLLK